MAIANHAAAILNAVYARHAPPALNKARNRQMPNRHPLAMRNLPKLQTDRPIQVVRENHVVAVAVAGVVAANAVRKEPKPMVTSR